MDAEQAEVRVLEAEVEALKRALEELPAPGEDTARVQYVALLRPRGRAEVSPLGCAHLPADVPQHRAWAGRRVPSGPAGRSGRAEGGRAGELAAPVRAAVRTDPRPRAGALSAAARRRGPPLLPAIGGVCGGLLSARPAFMGALC